MNLYSHRFRSEIYTWFTSNDYDSSNLGFLTVFTDGTAPCLIQARSTLCEKISRPVSNVPASSPFGFLYLLKSGIVIMTCKYSERIPLRLCMKDFKLSLLPGGTRF
uniref:Uncharacterized protein n=1 Tax=Compsopogon caeruleus TaxID=31354 RepID=A0A6T6CRD1_9RHOD